MKIADTTIQKGKVIYSIQFLRGIAAVMVVMSHIKTKGYQFDVDSLRWFDIGFSGVDLFFIISGFIMCYVTNNKPISFTNFFGNRIKRIIPLYWVLTLISLFIYLTYPHLVNSSGGKTSIISSFTLIPNGDKLLIQNGWTLSYEFLYYIIFSLFIMLTENRLLRYCGICTLILILVIIGFYTEPIIPFFKFITHNLLLEFSFGILSFLIINNLKINKGLSILLIVLGLLALIINNNFITNMDPRSIYLGVPMFLIFTGVVGLECYFLKTKAFLLNAFEFLGNVSFSLYLSHPFVLVLAARLLNSMNVKNPYVFTSLMIIISIVCGSIVYQFVERKLIFKKK